ncbi:MAG: lamin tail domain-containing protein [Anaerolineales bacterium]|nr:lamin tail domain-containing protein [Anaerolineales bacterium]
MSSVTSLNGNPNIKFRIYGYDATSSGGTFRLDNVLVSGKCPYFPLKLIINEIAWAGTVASSDDEWIELYNPGSSSVDLTGWRLIAVDGSPDITLSGILAANDYYLLERGSDNAVQGNFADLVFTGDLGDTGEILRLRAPDGTIVDTANIGGGSWYAGSSLPPRSMERVGTVADGNLSWTTFQGVGSAVDAGNNPIHGTPGTSNTMTNITPTFTPSVTPSPTNTPTFTPTFTQTPSHTPTASGFRSVIINEIAWAGTASSLTDDEWIELYNPTALEVNITNWQIKAADGSPTIILSGKVPAGGYFLLERGDSISDDSAISDIAADQIYTSGSLSNTGEAITLYDGANTVIDTANGNGGAWPKGSSSTYESMERTGTSAESDSAWHTNTSAKRNGKNANGGDILGTPKSSNSPVAAATATTTSAPTATSAPASLVIEPRPIINEILARPGFDWNQDGATDVFDEFIEIKNLTAVDISLSGWKLDKLGSTSFSLPSGTLKPGERIIYYSKQTNLLLSDGGETVRLINSNGKIYDAFTYDFARTEDRSFCRLPDGNPGNAWFEDCTPTPNLSNTREGSAPNSVNGSPSPVCNLPDTIPFEFFLPECNGYGADIWSPSYWDQLTAGFKTWITDKSSKWDTFIE